MTAASVLAPERKVSTDDFKTYAEGTTINDVFGLYARKQW